MKEDFEHRTLLSICLLLTFNVYFAYSIDESELKRCCESSSGNSGECQRHCLSYLERMNGTEACGKDFNRILKCFGAENRDQCCLNPLISEKCRELCSNYDRWIINLKSICAKERQAILHCFVEAGLPDVPPTIVGIIDNSNRSLIRIECDARGRPNMTYQWRKNGDHMSERDNQPLEFNPERDAYAGYYQCYATNIHGTAMSDVLPLGMAATNSTKPVEGAPVFRDIADGPCSVIVTEGCNATFRCNASANPKARIEWRRDGEVVNAANNIERFEFSNDNQVLTVRNVCQNCVGGERRSDLMAIQCNASNGHGYVFRSATLNVLKKTKVTTDNVTAVVAPAENDTDRSVCCRAVSDPVVSLGTKITWYRKGEGGGCSVVADWTRENQTGVRAFDNVLKIKIPANDTDTWSRYGGEYVCVGKHRNSWDEQVVTINPNARVALKLDVQNTEDGKGAIFSCSFSSFSSPSTMAVEFKKFRWYLKNKEILNPIHQTISDIRISGDSSRTQSLTFRFIPSEFYGGRVRCVVEYRSQVDFSIYKEGVLPYVPEVSIKSSAYDVYQSKSFSLNCTVTNFDQIKATVVTYHWYKDGQVESHSTSNSPIFTKPWSLREEKSPVIIGCSATSKHETSAIQTATITVLKNEDKVCSNGTDSDQRITWPVTKVDGVAKRPCLNNATGECSRRCASSGRPEPAWEAADCSRCVAQKLTSILKELGKFEITPGNNSRSEVANVVKELSNFTNETKGLKYGDLSGSVEAVASLVRLQVKQQDQPPKKAEVKWAVEIINNLLEPKNGDSWTSLKQNNKSAAGVLLEFGDTYGRGLTQIINQTDDGKPVIEERNQVVLEAVSKKVNKFPQNFAFPSLDKGDWTQNIIDRISLNVYEQDIEAGKNDSLTAWSLYYRNINEFLPDESDYLLNSRVLSLSVAELKKGTHLNESVTVTLQHVSNMTEKRKRKCAYWKSDTADSREGSWATDGCYVVDSESNENQTVCRCNHLTNFAILMSRIPDTDALALSIISKIGCGVSIAALILTIIIYAATWKQSKSHQAAVLINLCVALIIANLVFLIGAHKTDAGEGACITVAVLLHYFFLAAFFLMLAEGVQLFIFVYFVFHVRQRRETAGLIVAGWVLPLIIVAISLGAKRTDGYGANGGKACWLSYEKGVFWAFVGPVLTITLINIVIIVAVLRKIVCTRIVSSKKDQDNNKMRKMAWSVAVLCPVLGIAWLFGVLSIIFDWIGFQYIFTIANSFQGLFIFIFHGLYNNKKSSEKISSFVSEVISRTPFKRRQDTAMTTSASSSTVPRGDRKGSSAGAASKDFSSQDKKSQGESFGDTLGKDGNPYSNVDSTALLETEPGGVSAQVHNDSTTTPL